jgi:hypothetical protein
MKKLFFVLLAAVFFAACDSSDSGSETQETPSVSFPSVTDSLDIDFDHPASLEISLTFPSGADTSGYTVTLSGFDAALLNIPVVSAQPDQDGNLFFDISAVAGASGYGEITVTVTDGEGETVTVETINYAVYQTPPQLYFEQGAETLDIVYGEEETVTLRLMSSGAGVPHKMAELSDPSGLLNITVLDGFTDSDGRISFKVSPKTDAPMAGASLTLTASVGVYGAPVAAVPLRYAVIPTNPVFTFNVPELYLDYGEAPVLLEVTLKRSGIGVPDIEITLEAPSGILDIPSLTATTDADGKAAFTASALNDSDASGVLRFSASAEGSPEVSENLSCYVLSATARSVEIRVALMEGLSEEHTLENNSGLSGSDFSIDAVNTASLYDGGLLLSAESGKIRFSFDNDIAQLPANIHKTNTLMTVDGTPDTPVKLLLVAADGSSKDLAIPVRTRKTLEAIDYHTGADNLAAGYPNLNKHYTLENNIDLAGEDWTTPIGYTSSTSGSGTQAPFTGTFNGKEHKIENLNMNLTSGTGYVALFSFIKGVGAEVSYLHISGTINRPIASGPVGTFLATILNDGASAHHVSASGTIDQTNGSTSGLVGQINGGILSNCFSDVFINASSNTGGLITGTIYDTTTNEAYVKNCYSTGNSYFGQGIAGNIDGYDLDAYVENTYATGTLGRTGNPGSYSYNSSAIAGIARVASSTKSYLRNSVALNEAIYSTGVNASNICRIAVTTNAAAFVNNYAYDGMTLNYGAGAANSKAPTSSATGNEGADIAKSGLTKSFFKDTLGWSEEDWDMDWDTDGSRTWKLPIIKGHMEEYQKARAMPAHLQ